MTAPRDPASLMESHSRFRPAMAALLGAAALLLLAGYSVRSLFAQNAPPTEPGTLALESPPERLPAGGWRLRWSATSGNLYKLQRWTSGDFGQPATPAWTDIAMVRANAPTAIADDPSAIAAPRGFYRVMRVDELPGTDAEPPTISPITTRFTAAQLSPAAHLEITATDNVGVTRVEFFNGINPLGEATRGTEANTWSFVIGLNPNQLGARFLVARAYDAAGNFANSPVFPLGLVDPDHFVPLGTNGLPVEGGIVPAVAPETWGPVEYRPGGRSLFGAGSGFFLRFPSGVFLRRINGQQVLEFTHVQAGFGAGYPLQLPALLERNATPARQLPVGPVSVDQIRALFDLPASRGLAVRLYQRFNLEWTAGEVDDGGILGAGFRVAQTGIPLPPESGGYPEFRLDFTRSRGVALPFQGEFSLPDGTDHPTRLFVGAGSPLWLTLRPNGEIALQGSAGVDLANGGFFRADLHLDDPFYHLSISADRARVAALGSFAELLPNNATSCIPAQATDTQLAQATRCLRAFQNAFRGFSGTLAAGDSGLAATGRAPAVPPSPIDAAASVLEAWAFSGLATGQTGLQLDTIRDLVRQAGQSAAGAPDFAGATAQRLALVRVRAALVSGGATGSPEARTELDLALAEAEAAALSRAQDSDAIASFAGLRQAVRALVDTEALRQQAGLTNGPLLTTALPALLNRFAQRYTSSLGVTRSDEFTPANNPILRGLDRFTAAEHVHQLIELIANAQLLGVTLQTTLLDEALGQLATQLFLTAEADLNAAETRHDYPAFLLALQDLTELIADRQLAIFPNPPALAALPDLADLQNYVQRLGVLLDAELTRPLGERSLNNQAAEVRALLAVYRSVPATITFAPGPLRRAFDQLEAQLDVATSEIALASTEGLGELLELLEAGTLHAEYGRRFGFVPAADWETVRLPRLTARLAQAATDAGGWSELADATTLLLDAADRQGLRNQQTPRRNTLLQVAALLQASRGTARTLLQQRGGLTGWADLLLPGEISVDNVAGSVRYHRINQTISGSFRGLLQLPKFGTRLNVQNASLRAGGAFDLSASGTLALPAGSPTLTAQVPDSQPLHLAWNADEGLRLSGAALFSLTNGMFFRGQVRLEDPIYQFHLEAGGLQIALAHNLASHVPKFPPAATFQTVTNLDETGLELWSGYLSGLNETLRSAGLVTNQTARAAGAPAEFLQPASTDLAVSSLSTWSELSALEAHFGARSNALVTLAPATEVLRVLAAGDLSQNERLAEAVGDPSADPGATVPPNATTTPPPSLVGVLQLDFGSGTSAAPASPGPAQALGRSVPGSTSEDVVVPDSPGIWNRVSALSLTNVTFANGAAAPGVTIQVARGLSSTDLTVDPTRQPVGSQIAPENLRGGVFASPVMVDSLTGFPPGAGPGVSFGTRIRGLAPGYYYVLGLVGTSRDTAGRFLVHAGPSSAPAANFGTQLLRAPGTDNTVTLWTSGVNFTLGATEIPNAGSDLIVVSERLPSVPPVPNELLAGQLAGLQIVAPRVRLTQFTAATDRIAVGSSVALSWNTRHAQRIILTGSDHSRLEFGPEDSLHELRVAPATTTTYTLTVTNRNGPALVSNLVVRVDGAQAVKNGAVTAAKDQFEIEDKAKELLDAAAECLASGREDCVIPTEEICGMVQPFLQDLRDNLFDCQAIRAGNPSPETLIATLRDAFNVATGMSHSSGTYGCDELTNAVNITEFTPLAECVLNEVYARTGLTNFLDRATNRIFRIDSTTLQRFQIAESLRLIVPVLDFTAEATGAGAGVVAPEAWVAGHATNILRRLAEGAGTPALASQRLESELADFADGLVFVTRVAGEFPTDVPAPSAALVENVSRALLSQVRTNLAQYQGNTFGLWVTNPRYWEQEVIQLRRAVSLNALRPSTTVSNLIRTAALDAANAMKGGANFSTELRPHDVQTLRFLQRFLPSSDFADPYRQRVRLALEFIRNEIPNPPAPMALEKLQRGDRFLGQLADLQLLVGEASARGTTVDLPAALQPLTLASNLLESARLSARQLQAETELLRYVRAVFEVRQNLKVGLSTLLKKDPVPGATPEPESPRPGGSALALQTLAADPTLSALVPIPGTDAFGLGLVRASYNALQDVSNLTSNRLAGFRATDDATRSPEFKLPAGLRVDRVFGEFYFNRQTGFLQGGFGGSLTVPDAGFNASIQRARVANDGSFTVQASTATPLSPPGFFLDAAVNLDFAPRRGLVFQGNGTLTLPSNVTTQRLSLSVSYDEPAHQVGYAVLAQDTNLRLGDDFVIFDLGGGLDLGTTGTSGKVTLRGAIGLFARQSPLPASVTRSNYWLTIDDATVSFATDPSATVVSIESGVLHLPEHFSTGTCPTNIPGAAVGPSIALSPTAPIRAVFRNRLTPPQFSGDLAFSRLGIRVPGLTNLAVEVCQARLVFPSNGLPRLTNLTATVQLPLPGQTNRIDIVDAAWAVDGFPIGTIRLRDNLSLFNTGGFDLSLLGTITNACDRAAGLTIGRAQGSLGPFFRLDGAFEFGVPPTILGNTNGGRVFIRTCGFLSGSPNRTPEVALSALALGGTFRLGGPQGLLIENGLLSLEGLTNLYAASATRPFVVRLAGNVNIPSGPRLGLQDARFTFTGAPAPRFTLGGFSIGQNPEYAVAPGLALNVTAGSLTFLNDTLPLPQLLFPNNVVLGLSATAAIPPGPDPVISGTVQGLVLRMVNGRPQVEVSGLGIRFANFEIPPLTLNGEVFIGGLSGTNTAAALALAGFAPTTPPPATGLFFAGRVGGTLNDVGVKALLAFDLNGPIGVCLDANAGPAGIPLGPTGFLLTGVQGGVSFQNSNGDPCDFTTFYPVGADGHPVPVEASPQDARAARPGAVISWDAYRVSLHRQRLAAEAERAVIRTSGRLEPQSLSLASTAPEFPCPTGDCPPASVNILCQPHPDEARFPDAVILKFSSLDAKALEQIGVTRSFVESLGTTPAAVGDGVAAAIRSGIDPLIPRANAALLGATRAAELNAVIEDQLNHLELTFSQLIRAAAGGQGSIYAKVLDIAYAGIPCPDATVKLAGTFSHAAVSTALSGTVGVVLSSSGSAGLVGSLNVLGVPVGRMKSFVNVTDDRGNPNPSYCGDAFFALGPLEFGAVRSKFECPGCVTGYLSAFGQLTGCLAETTIRSVLQRVAPQHATKPINQALAALNDEEKIGFVAHVLSSPPVPGLADCWRTAAQTALRSFAPSYALCGAVQPKIFGIPLGDSVVELRAGASRTNLAASFAFSPTYIVNNLGLCGATLGLACQPVFPALDSATFGFGLGFPDPVAASVDALNGRLSSPEALTAFTRAGFDRLLADATFTLGYQLNPFGFKLADGEGRVVLPNLTAHPARPGASAFVLPENRGLPSRLELLLAALQSDLLANPLWKGSAADIHLAFPEGSAQRVALQGKNLTFAKDYFPHGGFLGAGRVAMPRLLVDAPPAELGLVLDPSVDPLARLGAAAEVLGNYLLQTTNLGTLAFYVPAPNPPFFADGRGNPLTPPDLLAAIGTFNLSVPNLTNPYPFQVSFMRGDLEGRLIGIPLARASLVMQPATPTTPAFLRATSSVPTNSWLQSFLASANLAFEIRQAPPQPIEALFSGLRTSVVALAAQPSPAPAAVNALLQQVENGLADGLPKVSMELQVTNLRIPAPLTNLLTTANASAGLFAYSPRFQPSLVATSPVQRVRRDGGIALRGSFRFADLVTIQNAELAVSPKLNPTELPALSGLFQVPEFPLVVTTVRNANFAFNTEPRAGEAFLRGSGAVDPLVFRNPLDQSELFSIRPLAANVPTLAGRLAVVRAGTNRVAASLELDPARLRIPLLGPDVAITIHSATDPTRPFSLSTRDAWSAGASLQGALSIRDPAGVELARLGAVGQRFSAALTGTGMQIDTVDIQIPGSLQLAIYPTASTLGELPRTYTLGAGPGARLIVRRDGSFTLTAALDGALSFPSLPTPALRAGATLTLTQSAFSLAGAFEGGLLAPGATASGTIAFSPSTGLSLTGEAFLPPQTFGVFRLQGVDRPELRARLFQDGYALDNGARLQVVGVTSDLLAVAPFTNRANADFTTVITSGDFAVPNAFRVTGGRMELRRRSGVASLLLTNSPTLTLLPGAEVQTTLTAPFTSLTVASDGQFYADTGTRTVQLLGGASLRGRLEIGNTPGTGTPGLVITPSPLDFGTIDFGSVTSRVMRFRNSGTEPLTVGLLASSGAFVPARSDFAVAVAQFVDVPVEFRPSLGGPTNALLSVVMSPGGAPPAVTLSGTARPVPLYAQHPTTLGFGSVVQGRTSARTLTVRNLGLAPLVLSNATLTGPFTLATPVSNLAIAPGGSAALTVNFSAGNVGATNGSLTFTANTAARLHVTELTGTSFTERWVLVHEGGPTLRGIALADDINGWAVGDDSTVLRTDTGGRSWQAVTANVGGDLRGIATSGDRVVLVGRDGVVTRSLDRGTTWRRVTGTVASAPTNHWEAVVFNPEGNLVLAGSRSGGGGILAMESTAGIQTVALPTEALHALAQFKGSLTLSNRLIAVGDAGLILRSVDGGSVWTTSTVTPALPLRGVALSRLLVTDTDPRVLVVGDGGLLLRSTSFLGALQRSIFTLRDLRAVSGSLAVGQDGFVVQAPTFNTSFALEDTSGAYDFEAATSSGLGTYAAGQAGQIWFRPSTPLAGPFLTLDPGQLDFGVLGAGQSRVLEVQVANRGPLPLSLTSIAVNGSTAFTVSPAQLLNIPSNGVRTVTVRYTPPALASHAASLEFTSTESATKQRVTLLGRAQANDWLALAEPGAARLVDLEMPVDNLAFAASAGTLFKSTNRGTNWTVATTTPGTVSRLHFFSSTLGFAVGGETSFRVFPPCTNDCQSFILRTADGGNTWSSRPTGVSTPVADVHFATALIGYALTRSESTLGRVTAGAVLRTADGGLTWTAVTTPTPVSGAFNGGAVFAVNGTSVFVTTGGELHRSTTSGASWTRVLDFGTSTVLSDLQFIDANNGVLIGSRGVFRRTITGGATSTSWTPQTAFTTADLRRVRFVNNTTGWITGADATAAYLFRTDNGGGTWVPEIAEPLAADGGPTGVAARSPALVLATDGSAVLQSSAHTAVVPPIASLPTVRDLGVLPLGTTTDVAVPLRNLGTNTLTVTGLALDSGSGDEAFTVLTPTPFTVSGLGSATIQVRYAGRSLGRSVARLTVASNGFRSSTTTELVAEARVFPTPLTFESEPAGLTLNIDNRGLRAAPFTVTVVGPATVPNDVLNPFEWAVGTAHAVVAPTNQIRGEFEYRFQGWVPAQPDATLRLTATNVATTYRAVFVPIRVGTPVAAEPASSLALASVGPRLESTPPAGLPHGPFVRVSSATLVLPGLGEAAVSGSALLASDRFTLALSTARLGDPALVAVDGGSWSVAYTNAPQRFVVRAQNPGLTVLNTPVGTESQVTFDVASTQISAQFRTLGATPFVPGVAELGAATLQFTSVPAGSGRFASFTTTASLRALPKPGGGFAIDRTLAFRAADGPFTNAITAFPNPLLDTPLLALRPGTGARLEIRRNAQGVYGVQVSNFTLSLLGGPATAVSGNVDGTRLSFATGRTLGLGQLVYTADTTPSLEWDLATPSFRAVMPAGALAVPGLTTNVRVPNGLVLDTGGNFDVRLPLPALTFNGISLNAGGPLDHNFVRFFRRDGVSGFQARDRRSFLGNTFKLAIDIASTGVATGSFAGELVLRDFLGCDEIGLGNLTLRYDSTQPDFQFQGRAVGTLCSAASADFRVQFGSGGGRVCHLLCVNGSCNETACLSTP